MIFCRLTGTKPSINWVLVYFIKSTNCMLPYPQMSFWKKIISLFNVNFTISMFCLLFLNNNQCLEGGCSYVPIKVYNTHKYIWEETMTVRFMGPTWGPSGADRTQVGPMFAPWTLLSGKWLTKMGRHYICKQYNNAYTCANISCFLAFI